LAFLVAGCFVLAGLATSAGSDDVLISASTLAASFLTEGAGSFFVGDVLPERFSGVAWGLKNAVREF